MQNSSPTKINADFRHLISESVILTSPRKPSTEATSPTSPPSPSLLSPPSSSSNILKSPTKKDSGTFLPQQQYVRVPISISLLHSISQLKGETNRTLYDRRLKTIREQAQKLVDKQIKIKDLAKLDFLSSFVQSQSSETDTLDVNWNGVVVKLHEIIGQTNSYEKLLRDISKLRKPGSTSSLGSSNSSFDLFGRKDSIIIHKEQFTAVRTPPPSVSLLSNLLGNKNQGPNLNSDVSSVDLSSPPSPSSVPPILSTIPVPHTVPIVAPPELGTSLPTSSSVTEDFKVITDPVLLPDGSEFSNFGSSFTSSSSIPSSRPLSSSIPNSQTGFLEKTPSRSLGLSSSDSPFVAAATAASVSGPKLASVPVNPWITVADMPMSSSATSASVNINSNKSLNFASLQAGLNNIANGSTAQTAPVISSGGFGSMNSNGSLNPANVNFGTSITSQMLGPSSAASTPLSIARRKSVADTRFSASPVPSFSGSQKDPRFIPRVRQTDFGVVEVEGDPSSLKSSGSFFVQDVVDDMDSPAADEDDTPVISDTHQVPSSSSFRPTTKFLTVDDANAAAASPKLKDLSLPSYLDIILFWGANLEDSPKLPTGIALDLRMVLFTMNSLGRLDHFLRNLITFDINRHITYEIGHDAGEGSPLQRVFQRWASQYNVDTSQDPSVNEKLLQKFKGLISENVQRVWNKEKQEKYLNILVTANKLHPSNNPNQSEEEVVKQVVEELEADLLYLTNMQHKPSLKYIEYILVGLLGHPLANIRSHAVRLLNVLYDGHAWQNHGALRPVVRVIGDAFRVEIDYDMSKEQTQNSVYLLTVSPHSSTDSPVVATPVSVFATHDISSRKLKSSMDSDKLIVEMRSFEQAGYYDWRLAELDESGEFIPIRLAPKGQNSRGEIAQGRFIVHPSVREEILHEVWVDLQDSVWDTYNGSPVRRGTFATVIRALEEYAAMGITTVYLMGALDHRSEDHPFCPTDRATPTKYLGGEKDFLDLVAAAKARNIKLVVDSTSKLGARKAHRKYKALTCLSQDKKGYTIPAVGNDSVEFEWPECSLLNYRKLATWDLLISETIAWGERGVDGIRLDGAHTWPLVLRPDLDELYRTDSDGELHYSSSEILNGDVILPMQGEAKEYGYWGTLPPNPTRDSKIYPNPLMIKLTRELWARFPKFMFLAEVHWDRELPAIVSGLIPYSCTLPKALSSVFSKGLNKDGGLFDLGVRQTVRAFYDYYEMRSVTYPENSILIYPSSSHHTPYPLAFFGHGTWSAVDLLFFLPELPLTYIGEQNGWVHNVDIYTSKVKHVAGFSSTPQPQIRGHYIHRATMRKNNPLLHSGGMLPLLCYSMTAWHDMVFGFARFLEGEAIIVAINFAHNDADFYVDCSPLAKIFTDDQVIYRMSDMIDTSNPPQYLTREEFLYEKHFVTVKPFSCLCWRIATMTKAPASLRVLYEHSMSRLKQLLAEGIDTAHNFMYSLIVKGFQSILQLEASLEEVLAHLLPSSDKNMARFLQGVMYHIVKTQNLPEIKALATLRALQLCAASPRVSGLCKDTMAVNSLGPIVFVTPEFGRFSTVGGVGVMLDELARSLVLLGCEVYVISPYYNYGKDGKTPGYLEKEEFIKWERNITTFIGNEKVEVGVHSGVEFGVKHYFLHHFTYFPAPYSSGGPDFQLKALVLFAKASLELLCQVHLLPSVIVTNDWFTGLVPAYVRVGAFGTTFNGTTLFHLVHNLEEAYQGRIFPNSPHDDMSYIHNLPRDWLIDPHWSQVCLNASRCALLTCNNWGTVSTSYLYDLLRTNPLSPLLYRFPTPFAHSNGIRVAQRKAQLAKIAPSHEEAKKMLQKKYFAEVDPTIPVFSFVGRIVLQKGVHLILNAVHELLQTYQGKIQILVGGAANMSDPYGSSCAWSMQNLSLVYKGSFWAAPDKFFSDGPLVNLGSDFALMPSLFEPSGVVQQEYFVAGTPVIAFKTGGLKDTVFEYLEAENTGNGFTFEAHRHADMVQAIHRAITVFKKPQVYQKLRENCMKSVLDMSVVAEAWAREFSRLRRCIWADANAIEKRAEALQEEYKNEKKAKHGE
eukprot:Phypoly_transcript_00161.p1 GENE.Phypoly_transcript_00161~~Phypoly_transcript_00161.p1  ORF type:complete len:2059 (-),score=306.68 Phypoly_transcript_00161:106-6282(-)